MKEGFLPPGKIHPNPPLEKEGEEYNFPFFQRGIKGD